MQGLGSKKGAFLTIVSVIVALIVAMATIQSTQASIDYWLQQQESYTLGINQITVYCKNGGGMDGDFNIVLKLNNATFSKQTQMPYTIVDDSTVKIKFVLHEGDSIEKTIFLNSTTEQDFRINIDLERTSLIQFLKPNAMYPTQISYRWNELFQTYNCTDMQ